MKLKLDLHPIYNQTFTIESALQNVIDEAIAKRASEVEIIPGKGSGALKKSVLRFLDRPDIKARYHRIEKDGDNWGRLFVHFRHERHDEQKSAGLPSSPQMSVPCACCKEPVTFSEPEKDDERLNFDCPWCGSPNLIKFIWGSRKKPMAVAELDYGE